MKFKHDNTIITWIEDNQLAGLVKQTAKELNLNVFKAREETDIYAVPYFFLLIDGNNINNKILKILTEIIASENPKEFAVLLTTKPDCKIPGAIKKYFLKPQEVITPAWLKTTLLNKKHAISRHKSNKRAYDKTIYRTVYILRKLMRKNAVIFMDELCSEFSVSEKTIKRDIYLLNNMGEDIIYDRDKKGYVLKFSASEILFTE